VSHGCLVACLLATKRSYLVVTRPGTSKRRLDDFDGQLRLARQARVVQREIHATVDLRFLRFISRLVPVITVSASFRAQYLQFQLPDR